MKIITKTIIIIATLALLTGCSAKQQPVPESSEPVVVEEALPEEVIPKEKSEDELPEEEVLEEEITDEELDMGSTKADEYWDEPFDEPSVEESFTKGYLIALESTPWGAEAFWLNFESDYLMRDDAKGLPNYEDMVRYPDVHINKHVQLDGVTVKQVVKEEGNFYQLIIDYLNDGGKPAAVECYIRGDDPRIIAGDRLTIGGTFQGLIDFNNGYNINRIPFISGSFTIPSPFDVKPRKAVQDWYNNKIYAINYKRQMLTCFDGFTKEIDWQIPAQEGYIIIDIDVNENAELLIEMALNQLGSEKFVRKISLEGEVLSEK